MTQYAVSFGASPFSDTAIVFALTAATALSFTVPGTNFQKYKAVFHFPLEASVYVGLNSTPVTPVAGTASSAPNVELNPTPKFVKGGDVLNFFSTTALADASVQFYSLTV